MRLKTFLIVSKNFREVLGSYSGSRYSGVFQGCPYPFKETLVGNLTATNTTKFQTN